MQVLLPLLPPVWVQSRDQSLDALKEESHSIEPLACMSGREAGQVGILLSQVEG